MRVSNCVVPMTLNYPSLTRRSNPTCGLFALLIALLAFSSPSRSQEISKPLKQALADFSDTLKNKDSSDTYATSALKFTRQLQDATEDFNERQFGILTGNLKNLNFGAYHETLHNLLQAISTERSRKNEQDKQIWSTQVSTLIEKVKQACIDDAPSYELEILLIEVAGVGLKRPQFIDMLSHWAKMETGKLDSASRLINRWLDYKAFKEAGDMKRAQSKLEYLQSSPELFPILEKSFLDDKVTAILRARGITETTRIEYHDEKKVMVTTTHPLKSADHTTPLGELQKQIIRKLKTGKWDGKTVSGYAKTLKESLEKEPKPVSRHLHKINNTIKYLGDCLLALEKNDLSKAQVCFLLSDFGHTTIPLMKPLERKAVSNLLPLIYPNANPSPLREAEPLNRYMIEILSEQKQIDYILDHYQLISWIAKSHWGATGIPEWKKPAYRQYLWLSRSRLALETQDFPRLLYTLRTALYYAPDAGPASAQNLIEIQIRKLKESQPELFELSDTIEERLSLAEKQILGLETKLKESQTNN